MTIPNRALLRSVLAILCIAAAHEPRLSAQSVTATQSDSVHHRNDCRLAVQVLQHGEPAGKWGWALGRIGACGADGGRVIGGVLLARRHEAVRSRALDEIVNGGLGLLDRTLYEAAMEVASDRSAGTAARVQAFRILLSQIDLSSPPTYEDLAEGAPRSIIYDWSPAFGQPLPAGYVNAVLDVATAVVNQNPSTPVYKAAQVVRSAASVAIRRKQL